MFVRRNLKKAVQIYKEKADTRSEKSLRSATEVDYDNLTDMKNELTSLHERLMHASSDAERKHLKQEVRGAKSTLREAVACFRGMSDDGVSSVGSSSTASSLSSLADLNVDKIRNDLAQLQNLLLTVPAGDPRRKKLLEQMRLIKRSLHAAVHESTIPIDGGFTIETHTEQDIAAMGVVVEAASEQAAEPVQMSTEPAMTIDMVDVVQPREEAAACPRPAKRRPVLNRENQVAPPPEDEAPCQCRVA